jgi:hypothetical protein
LPITNEGEDMAKVTPIKDKKVTQCFSYEVTMLIHIIADDADTARKQLDEKGGIVTKRDVKLLNADVVYGEGNLDPK